jgi:hypothetical protein
MDDYLLGCFFIKYDDLLEAGGFSFQVKPVLPIPFSAGYP